MTPFSPAAPVGLNPSYHRFFHKDKAPTGLEL